MAISDLVRRLRDKKNWTIDELVEHSGVCRRTLQEVEYHGRTDLTVKTIKKLAKALEVKPETIFRHLL